MQPRDCEDVADPKAILLLAQEFKNLGRKNGDFAYALLYYKLAAELGEGVGMFNLGIMVLKGIGIPANTNR